MSSNGSSKVNRYLALTIGAFLVALAGYWVFFATYPQFSLSSTARVSFLALAVMAGFASLFSPCSFPLLVTLLVSEAGTTTNESPSIIRLIRFALVFSLGAVIFLLLTGAALSLGAGPVMQRINFSSPAGRLLRLVMGLILIGFGWWQFQGRSFNVGWLNSLLQPLWRVEARLRHQRSTLRIGLYGFGYILAGFS